MTFPEQTLEQPIQLRVIEERSATPLDKLMEQRNELNERKNVIRKN